MKIENNVLLRVQDSDIKDGKFTVPDGVTSIGSYAFSDCSSLTSVTIPDSVTSIGSGAFRNCSSLTSITLGNSVTSIGNWAFENCYNLTRVYYTGDIASWCGITFGYYYSNPLRYAHNLYINNELIKEIVIPDTVTGIKADAFSDWNGTSITIPDGVTSIGECAFSNCGGLTSVTIGNSVTSIGEYAFLNCSSLTSITIGNGVTSIGDYAFNNCPVKTATISTLAISCIPKGNLKTVVITSGESIGDDAFYNCSSLTSVTIGNSVTSIGDCAFSNCSSLTSITIPDSVTSIGGAAFSGCYHLVEVYNKSSLNIEKGIEENGYVGYYAKAIYTEEYTSKLSTDSNGYVIYTDGEDKILIGYTGEETELTLPEGITEINQGAFYGNNKITSITIPDNVTSIGECAFSNCGGLTSVTIGNSVTSIGEYAFSGCSRLASITLGNSVTFIGRSAFYRCFSLTSITIPDSVTGIGSGAFYECNNLKSRESNYKAFEIRDGKLFCRKKEYKLDKRNFVQGELILCRRGVHYCTNLFEIFNYYWGKIDEDIAIYEVKPGSRIVEDKYCSKHCTNSIRLVKRLYREDIIKILNGGKDESENL